MGRRRVDIGSCELDAVVAGDGPVTVVFENGLATALEEWDLVVPHIVHRARIVRYNHRSAPPDRTPPPRSIADVLADLEELLAALSVKPPYVFVGHIWGGVVARLFACAHPSDVVGLVFVDATHEAIDSPVLAVVPSIYSLMLLLGRVRLVRRGLMRQLCPPNATPAYRARIDERMKDDARWPIGLRTARAESAAISGALARLRRECPDLPPIPVRVLTNGTIKTKSARRARDGWKSATARAASAQYIELPASGHYVSFDAPDAVVQAITDVLDEAQSIGRA